MLSKGKLTGFMVLAAILGFMAGNFVETTALGGWLAGVHWGSLIVLSLWMAYLAGSFLDIGNPVVGWQNQGAFISTTAMIAGLIAFYNVLPLADPLPIQTAQVEKKGNETVKSDNGSIINSNDVMGSPINPIRPFGIELGKPFPSGVSYGNVKSTSNRTTYFLVDVPDPHRFFMNIAGKQYTTTSSNFYKVVVFNETNKVERVIARSAFETARKSVPSCSQANALYAEMKNATRWPSSMNGGWRISSQSPAGKSYQGDIVDRARPNTRYRAEFSCKDYTQYLEIQFKYTKFYE